MFLTIEGIDKVGKTSVCRILRERLSKNYSVRVFHDPPGLYPWASKPIRDLLLRNKKVTSTARAIVFLAARIDAYNRAIRSALDRNDLVIGDRFHDSWFAYQADKTLDYFGTTANSLAFLSAIDLTCMRWGLLCVVDKTFLVLGDPRQNALRGKRKKASLFDSIETQENVQRNYLMLAKRHGKRVEIIDSRGLSVNQLARTLEAKIRRLLRK